MVRPCPPTLALPSAFVSGVKWAGKIPNISLESSSQTAGTITEKAAAPGTEAYETCPGNGAKPKKHCHPSRVRPVDNATSDCGNSRRRDRQRGRSGGYERARGRGPRARRHRHGDRAREQRRRVLGNRRAPLPWHTRGGRRSSGHVHASRLRPCSAVCLRARDDAREAACDVRDEIERDYSQHALLG